MSAEHDSSALVADIGGTHCRLALVSLATLALDNVVDHRCEDFPRLEALLDTFLAGHPPPTMMSLAVPGPAHGEHITLVNSPWRRLDATALRRHYPYPVYLVNDFAAQAHAIPLLRQSDLEWWWSADAPQPQQTRAIIGPGTGLGAAALTADHQVIASEAGHVSFAPTTPLQRQLLEALLGFMPRVYNEALASGPGLANLYRGLQCLKGRDRRLPPEAVSERARAGDGDCLAATSEFSRILGAICGDLALAYGAVGGVYLSGGLLAALGELVDRPSFLAAFADKGAYHDYCQAIPIARITHPHPGLLGAAAFARRQLPQEQD